MYNVLIIGAGSIGALKDDCYDSPTTENILTHAHAVKVHPEFNLYTIVDIDQDKLNKVRMKWNVVGFRELAYVNNKKIDVVVIATPTETHLDIYEKIRNWRNLKVVIVEKPCTENLIDICAMDSWRQRFDQKIIVNYTRRFIPYYKQLREQIKKRQILSCVIHYVRGLKRDGCHAIDLCRYFFGEIQKVKKLNVGFGDYSEDDTTDCIWMQAEHCPNIVMVPGDGRIADCFDFQIMTDQGMWCLYNHGSHVFMRKIDTEKIYGSYNSLYAQQEAIANINMGKTLLMNLYDHVYEFINGCEPICTIDDAIKIHELIEKIRK